MTAVMNGHAPIGAEVLSREEGIALSACEERIERGLATFIDVGLALAEIREARLYRIAHDTFENYCRARWGFNDRRASQYIQAADLASTIVEAGLPAPQNEGQARALGQVAEEKRAEVWAEVTETDGKVTAEKIRDAADARKPDLAPTILGALAGAGRDGLDLKAITAAWTEPPSEKDLTRALEKLVKSGEIVVTRAWANGKPRKWASAEAFGDLTPDVERVLADAGPDGRTAWQIAFILAPGQPGPKVAALAVRVAPVLERLAADGKARGWDAEGGMRWALPEPANTETPGSVEAGAPAPSADPGSEYRSDPAERIAAVADVAPEFVKPAPASAEEADRIRLVGEARRKAQRLVPLVASAINEIEIGIAFGEQGLATAEMVAGLRAQADRLEQYVKEKKA